MTNTAVINYIFILIKGFEIKYLSLVISTMDYEHY
jgi:hypothetical protein